MYSWQISNVGVLNNWAETHFSRFHIYSRCLSWNLMQLWAPLLMTECEKTADSGYNPVILFTLRLIWQKQTSLRLVHCLLLLMWSCCTTHRSFCSETSRQRARQLNFQTHFWERDGNHFWQLDTRQAPNKDVFFFFIPNKGCTFQSLTPKIKMFIFTVSAMQNVHPHFNPMTRLITYHCCNIYWSEIISLFCHLKA